MVAAQNMHGDAVVGQPFDGGLAVGFERVGQGKCADGLPVERHGGNAGNRPNIVHAFRQPAPAKFGLAHLHFAPICNAGADAFAGHGVHILNGARCDAACRSSLHHGIRQRMRGVLFHSGGHFKQLLFGKAFGRPHGGDVGFACRQRAGFVQHHRIHRTGGFQRGGVFKPHAVPHRLPHTGHNRRRCRQAQSTGAGHHQHGHGADECGGPIAQRKSVGHKSQQRNGQHGRHEYRRHFVRQPRNRGFAALRVGQRAHHIAQQRIAAELFGAVIHAAGKNRARQHFAANRFMHRLAFAREVAFVRPAFARQHRAVRRNPATLHATQRVADLDLAQRHGLPGIVFEYGHFARRELQQRTERV